VNRLRDRRLRTRVATAAAATAVLATLTTGAWAVSGGGYTPGQQDCSPTADANNFQGAEPGCHNLALNVEDSQGHRYASVGTEQEAQGDNVHAADANVDSNGDGTGTGGSVAADTNYQPFAPGDCDLFDIPTYPINLILAALGQGAGGCSLDPQAPSGAPTVTPAIRTGTPNGSAAQLTDGATVYFGADDNLDTGEHDGVDSKNGTRHSANGPSDGGAIVVNWHPKDAAAWIAALSGFPSNPGGFLSNPVPLVDGGFGACADGMCASVQTRQRTVYQGGTAGQRDVANYDGKNWDPEACDSGSSADERQCAGPSSSDPDNMDGYRKAEKSEVDAEPGVQVYEDPDPQASPLTVYPLPAGYAGTCGVILGGGAAPAAPASPFTNSAGQVVISTGC
jgi:hypothetical protein